MTVENDGVPQNEGVVDDALGPPTDPLPLDHQAEPQPPSPHGPPEPPEPGTGMHGSMEGDLFDGPPPA